MELRGESLGLQSFLAQAALPVTRSAGNLGGFGRLVETSISDRIRIGYFYKEKRALGPEP